MRRVGVWLLLFAAWTPLACSSSTVALPAGAQLRPTATPVAALTPTASRVSPASQVPAVVTAPLVAPLTTTPSPIPSPTRAQPSPTPTPVPDPTSTPTPSPVPTRVQSSATATAVPTPTGAGSPFTSQEAGDGQPGIPPSSLAAGERRLAVIENGDWRFIKNGGRVNLRNGLSVELFLDPYPPKQLTAMLDLYLTRRGQPVTGASADIAYDMKGMFHGPFLSVAKNLGQGHYLLTIDYIMYSAWEHKLTMYLPEDRYELAVGVVVSPSPTS